MKFAAIRVRWSQFAEDEAEKNKNFWASSSATRGTSYALSQHKVQLSQIYPK